MERSGGFKTASSFSASAINRAKHSVEKWKKSLIVIECLAKYF